MAMYASIWGWIVSFAAAMLLRLPMKLPNDDGEPDNTPLFPPYIGHNLGQYSPYFSVEPYIPGPASCRIKQVNLLYRHGARCPTIGASLGLQSTLAKFKSVNKIAASLRFVKDYKLTMGVNDLLPFGAAEARRAGQAVFERYSTLTPESRQIGDGFFLRASGSQRVIDAATNWSLGVAHAAAFPISIPYPIIVPEDPQTNNTLENHNCPAFNSTISEAAQVAFLPHFAPPITKRLNSGAPGASLEDSDTINLFFLCAFDSVYIQKLSHFCGLFSESEFVAFEYYQDLGKYYHAGYGNPLVPVQGVGYVNELVARLTGHAVANVTNVNRTLDADPQTFPLGRSIYADFSHDNQMGPIYTSLGLHKPLTDLPTDRILSDSPWITSHLLPFSAQLVVEKYVCDSSYAYAFSASASALPAAEWIRILNDDKVIEVPGCSVRGEGGLCELSAFVDTLKYAMGGAADDWAKCQSNDPWQL